MIALPVDHGGQNELSPPPLPIEKVTLVSHTVGLWCRKNDPQLLRRSIKVGNKFWVLVTDISVVLRGSVDYARL